MKLRVALKSDIPTLVAMGSAFIHESTSFKQRGFIPEKASKHFEWLIDGNGVVFLAEDEGEIIGGFAGGITTDWQSDHKLAFDYVMYVSPKFRSTGVARELVFTFILWAKEMGANRINCGTATMVNTDQCVKLYESLGFINVGSFLELEV